MSIVFICFIWYKIWKIHKIWQVCHFIWQCGMKYLELFTATVRDNPPESLTYCRYFCYPVGLQDKYLETNGYADFNIDDQKLADEFIQRTGLVEMFQGYGTLDEDHFEYKLTTLDREDWEFFLNLYYLPQIDKYIPINQIPSEAEAEALDLYWYHPGSHYYPRPITDNLLKKCEVKVDHGDPRTLVPVG